MCPLLSVVKMLRNLKGIIEAFTIWKQIYMKPSTSLICISNYPIFLDDFFSKIRMTMSIKTYLQSEFLLEYPRDFIIFDQSLLEF